MPDTPFESTGIVPEQTTRLAPREASDQNKLATEAPEPANGQTVELASLITVAKPFTLQTPDGVISESGIRSLQDYICCQNLPELPPDLEYVWLSKRGTLPKRIQSFYHKVHKAKLAAEQISEIGNIARRNCDLAKQYILDFTNSIDWKDGDFGDSGSCFWGSNAGAKEMLEEHAYAVRAYTKRNCDRDCVYSNLHGYARAWLAPIEHNKLIVFNGYGETSLTFARLLALKFSCAYKRINLLNNGRSSGTMYINGGGSYVLGVMSEIQPMETYDLKWEDCDSCQVTCYMCDDYVHEDSAVTGHTRNGAEVNLCESCGYYCESCEHNFTYGLHYDEPNDAQYCEECYQHVLENRDDESEGS